MPDMTTIKLSKTLRDRISAGAAALEQTVHVFLEKMLDAHERRRRLDQVAAAYGAADEETLHGWRAETRDWETIETDLVIVVPATTTDRGWPHHIHLHGPALTLRRPTFAMTELPRPISRIRITDSAGLVDASCLGAIRRRLDDFLHD